MRIIWIICLCPCGTLAKNLPLHNEPLTVRQCDLHSVSLLSSKSHEKQQFLQHKPLPQINHFVHSLVGMVEWNGWSKNTKMWLHLPDVQDCVTFLYSVDAIKQA